MTSGEIRRSRQLSEQMRIEAKLERAQVRSDRKPRQARTRLQSGRKRRIVLLTSQLKPFRASHRPWIFPESAQPNRRKSANNRGRIAGSLSAIGLVQAQRDIALMPRPWLQPWQSAFRWGATARRR